VKKYRIFFALKQIFKKLKIFRKSAFRLCELAETVLPQCDGLRLCCAMQATFISDFFGCD
jgi:hypothetical protein